MMRKSHMHYWGDNGRPPCTTATEQRRRWRMVGAWSRVTCPMCLTHAPLNAPAIPSNTGAPGARDGHAETDTINQGSQ